jgi:hypothetical protein
MRSFIVVLIIMALAVPASAQGRGGGKKSHGDAAKSEQRKPKVDEKAAQSALDKLPDKKFDPWQTVREPSPPK